ncbi:MAG: hypothetical protein P4L55_15235 [Syntrophobacteraceae bacterium]|nr:hypothetical protein [Syntrophobacteraceae bacterium]
MTEMCVLVQMAGGFHVFIHLCAQRHLVAEIRKTIINHRTWKGYENTGLKPKICPMTCACPGGQARSSRHSGIFSAAMQLFFPF